MDSGPVNSGLPTLTEFSEPPRAGEYREALLDIQGQMIEWVGFEPTRLRRRLEALMHIARHDLGLSRLAEGHLDALSILDEAGMKPHAGALYGIWASGGPADTTVLDGLTVQTLAGSKPFCSGAGLVDRALIWVGSANTLVEVDLVSHAQHHRWDGGSWRVGALAGVQTWTGTFNALPIERRIGNGDRDWYFERAGFWLGALCPAACWAGGALGLLDYAISVARDHPISQAHLGRMLSAAFGMESALLAAATPISPAMAGLRSAHARALAARHLAERASTQIIDEFSRLLGPRPLTAVPSIARRIQELQIYQRQSHADHDLAELAATVIASSSVND